MLRFRHVMPSALLLSAAFLVACSDDTSPNDGVGGEGGASSTGGSQSGGGGAAATGGSGTGGTGGSGTGGVTSTDPEVYFNRIASFPVCMQLDATCDDDTETSAEIVTATTDGMTLIYSDSPRGVIGYVDITDAAAPAGLKTTDVGGEPTSVTIKGKYALVAVNTSPSFVAPSGVLKVYDTETKSDTPVATIDLGGQPDSIAVSPDGAYAAVVIENERDESFTPSGLEEGDIPQLPAGKLVVIDLSDESPANWTGADVALTGLMGLVAPTDPEPEFVDINSDNVAVVTFQENNGIALVDLATKAVTTSFSCGTVDLTKIDKTEEGPAVISATESLSDVPREPDGVAWIGTDYFATADEGDWLGGGRGFTVFKKDGTIVYSSGSDLDHWSMRAGHYPDSRSKNKGNEPENIEYAEFGDDKLLFVNSERSSLVFVFDVADPEEPVFRQILPAGVAPEGGYAIPERDLLVVASEADARDDKIRSVVNIYERGAASMSYPTLLSDDRADGTPISWAALSGLAAANDGETLYSIEDSYFGKNRIFTIDTSDSPARVTDELTIMDTDDIFSAVTVDDLSDDADAFSSADLAKMINADKTVNIDPEGIALASDGGFWVASEGAGTMSDTANRPIDSLNFIFKVSKIGVIQDVITLPGAVNAAQVRFGFEGVTEYDGKLFVAFQRTWAGDTAGKVRIGIYDITAKTWEFVFYTLDAVTSQNGGWVGLSDITSLGAGKFLVLERDDQGGPDAAIKKLYTIDLASYTDGDDVAKTSVRNLMTDLMKTGGLAPEKIEGSAVDADGNVWIVNDNDGVEDNSGETQLLKLGKIL